MIIVQSRQTDNTTIQLIRWLIYIKKNFFRINFSSDLSKVFKMTKYSLYYQGIGLIRNNIEIEDKELSKQVYDYLSNDIKAVLNNIHFNATKDKIFGNTINEVNKLNALTIAENAGLNVPK